MLAKPKATVSGLDRQEAGVFPLRLHPAGTHAQLPTEACGSPHPGLRMTPLLGLIKHSGS